MNVTIKGIPPKIHRQLKARAQANKRSLNGEVLVILERSIGNISPSVEVVLAEAQELRKRFKGPPLSEEFLQMAKNQGRA